MLWSGNMTNIRPVLGGNYPNFTFFDNNPPKNPIKLTILTSTNHVSARYTFIQQIPRSSHQILDVMMVLYGESA